jgi:hypothetical protein
MIAFLDARHPEVAPREFRWLPEAPLNAGSGVRFGPERMSNHVHHSRFGQAVASHAGEGVLAQDYRFHDAVVATIARRSTHA